MSYVITGNGRKVLKSDCVRIGGHYYEYGMKLKPHVVMIRGDLEIFDPSVHIFWHDGKKPQLQNNDGYYTKLNLMITFVDKDGKQERYPHEDAIEAKYGDIASGFIYAVTEQGKYMCFETEESAEKSGFAECFKSEQWVPANRAVRSAEKITYRTYRNTFSSPDGMPEKKAARLGLKSTTFVGTGGMRYTFGVEIETRAGRLPRRVYTQKDLNLECVKDGSLREPNGDLFGGEYVTGVLIGDNGLRNLQRSVKAIHDRCLIDSRCGIHVHVGGYNATEQFNVLAWILAWKTQAEILSTLPKSRRKNAYAGHFEEPCMDNKGKTPYIKMIEKHGMQYGVDLCYEDMFYKLSNGKLLGDKNRKLSSSLNKYRNHPGGRYTDRYTRNIALEDLYRYNWLNLIPSVFNTREVSRKRGRNLVNDGIPYTLEFRCHGASMNYVKIRNWVLFCMCFTSYIENYPESILNDDEITIEMIIRRTLRHRKKSADKLVAYFQERSKKFGEVKDLEQTEYDERSQFTPNSLKAIVQ